MARQVPAPRKKRTRQHVLAALSLNHVERFIIEEGHTAERTVSDYGYDLTLFTYDDEGYAEESSAYIQLKATEKLTASGDAFVFDLDVRDYSLWTAEPMPVFLILFDASTRRAYWVYVQRYFAENTSRGPKQGAKTVRVRVPRHQVVNRKAIRQMRQHKQSVLKQVEGLVHHA